MYLIPRYEKVDKKNRHQERALEHSKNLLPFLWKMYMKEFFSLSYLIVAY